MHRERFRSTQIRLALHQGYRLDFRSSGNRRWSTVLNPYPTTTQSRGKTSQAAEALALPKLTCRSLDLNINAGRETQFIQFFNRLRCRLNDINQTLVSPDLVLLSRFLIHKGARQNRVPLDAGWKWNRTMHATVSSLCSIHDVLGTLVQNRVIVRFHTNSNYFTSSSRHRTMTQKVVRVMRQKQRKNLSNGTRRKSEDAGQARSLASLWTPPQPSCRGKDENLRPLPQSVNGSCPPKTESFLGFSPLLF